LLGPVTRELPEHSNYSNVPTTLELLEPLNPGTLKQSKKQSKKPMDIEALRNYCLAKKGVEETFPFGETTLVFKVAGKMFLLTSLYESPLQFNAKCDPGRAIELREQYDAIQPGYHMNKQHWNTIVADGRIPVKLLHRLIDDSYILVVQSLPKKLREQLL
jgi:predicted DNA-binding protein (MmcQ/YjbR family)